MDWNDFTFHFSESFLTNKEIETRDIVNQLDLYDMHQGDSIVVFYKDFQIQ